MARPALKEEERAVQVAVRFTPKLRDLLAVQAEKETQTLSEYIRSVLVGNLKSKKLKNVPNK